MGKIIKKIILDDTSGNVWKFITNPENFPRYVYGYRAGETTIPHATGIGATYKWYGTIGPFRVESTEKIVDWQAGKRVAYVGTLDGVLFRSSMDVTRVGKDQTSLTITIQYRVPMYLGGKLTDAILIQWMVNAYVKKSLYRLRGTYTFA